MATGGTENESIRSNISKLKALRQTPSFYYDADAVVDSVFYASNNEPMDSGPVPAFDIEGVRSSKTEDSPEIYVAVGQKRSLVTAPSTDESGSGADTSVFEKNSEENADTVIPVDAQEPICISISIDSKDNICESSFADAREIDRTRSTEMSVLTVSSVDKAAETVKTPLRERRFAGSLRPSNLSIEAPATEVPSEPESLVTDTVDYGLQNEKREDSKYNLQEESTKCLSDVPTNTIFKKDDFYDTFPKKKVSQLTSVSYDEILGLPGRGVDNSRSSALMRKSFSSSGHVSQGTLGRGCGQLTFSGRSPIKAIASYALAALTLSSPSLSFTRDASTSEDSLTMVPSTPGTPVTSPTEERNPSPEKSKQRKPSTESFGSSLAGLFSAARSRNAASKPRNKKNRLSSGTSSKSQTEESFAVEFAMFSAEDDGCDTPHNISGIGRKSGEFRLRCSAQCIAFFLTLFNASRAIKYYTLV